MRFKVNGTISCDDCEVEISDKNTPSFFYKTEDGAILCEDCYKAEVDFQESEDSYER